MKRVLLLVFFFSTLAYSQLRISANGHYLYEKQTGQPVFLNGESVWCLFTAITYTQADGFFQNCQQYGVNFLQTCIIEDGFSANAPRNTNGDTPFTGANFTTPRASYFAHADSILALAKRYNIYLHLYISYLGSNASEGWQTEIGAASIASMKSWGNYIGNRYKDSTNIIWGISGDTNPTPWQQKLDSMSIALLAQDTNHLVVPRDEPYTQTQTHWSGRSWLKLEYIYPYWGPSNYNPERIYAMAWGIYNSGRPGFLEEAWYENESGGAGFPTTTQLRQQMYYGPLAGALVGQVFGNCPMWHFGTGHNSVCGSGTYQSWLDSPGHVSLGWCGKLFRNRNWWTLVPDQSGTVLTAGASTGADRAVCSWASDSTTIMVYMPSSRQVTVTSAQLKGDSTHAWWFKPADGSTIDLGIQTKAPHNYTPTSGDWILVLDAKVMNYPAPGVNVSATAPPAPALATPLNGATGIQVNPTLTWNVSSGATSYRVQVSTSAVFSTTLVDQSSITTTSLALTSLSANTQYYWRVSATNAGGTSAFSSAWSFQTISTAPAVPVLQAPLDGAVNQQTTLLFVWHHSQSASWYRLQISIDTLFGSPIVDDLAITDTTTQVSFLSTLQTYYWRTRAENIAGTSPWSQRWQFNTGTLSTQAYPMARGWNLISIPLTVSDPRKTVLFPTATSNAFTFYTGVGYVRQDTLVSGPGYWIKFDSTQEVNIQGISHVQDTIEVSSGWNLVGSVYGAVDTGSTICLPAGIRNSSFFEYANGYLTTSTIYSGRAYWVKMNANGKLVVFLGSRFEEVNARSTVR